MAGGFIVLRYENGSTGSSDDKMCIIVCSPGILINAEMSVTELSAVYAASCSWSLVFIFLCAGNTGFQSNLCHFYDISGNPVRNCGM